MHTTKKYATFKQSFRQKLTQTHTHVGEFVHVCAIYLGIAVLVTLAAALVVPSIRDQTKLISQIVFDELRPEVVNTDNRGARTESRIIKSTDDGALLPSAYVDFAQVLQQASAELSISGVSVQQLQALRSYITRKYRLSPPIASTLIQLAYHNGREKQVDPLLILAVIAIESTYNPFVESHAGAQGLMQVMTSVHQDKLDIYKEEDLSVFSPAANIQAGTQILADCRKRRGSLEGSLACYVGAIGPSDGGYGAKVLAERRRIAAASGIAVGN